MDSDRFTTKNCNLANLCGMFCTVLDAIDLCLADGNVDAARHRIEQAAKSIFRLKVKNGITQGKAK